MAPLPSPSLCVCVEGGGRYLKPLWRSLRCDRPLKLCLVQVATVNALGLTGPERIWWESIQNSPVLLGETVRDFLDREDAPARRDLLHEASERPDGTYTISLGKAQVLADTLYARLRPGVLPWSEGVEPGAQ